MPRGGVVVFNGESILGNRAYTIFEKGIARTFQNIRLFSAMTAMVARHCRTDKGIVGSILRTLPRSGKKKRCFKASSSYN
jgi:branched-chain amino acid transport system ATP-binding protein